jgi:transcriptional regulator with XRE-family HTH domain
MSLTTTDEIPVDEAIGHRIRMARVNASMTQSQLGEHLGCSSQQIHKYERGSNRVSAGTLFVISQLLEYPVDWFFLNPQTPTEPDSVANVPYH